MSFSQHRRHDEGFSLAELLIAMALLSLVLAAAWGGMRVINKAASTTSDATTATQNAADPVEKISKCLMQNNMISATDFTGANPTGPNVVNVWTNPKQGANPELDSFVTVTGTGGTRQLLWRKWVTTSDMKTVVKSSTWIMSYKNANAQINVPLFTYYDASGTVVAAAADIPSMTRLVVIRVVASLSSSRTVEASRTVFFRNRN